MAPKIKLSKDQVDALKDAFPAPAPVEGMAPSNDRSTIPASMHTALAAYLIAVDEAERKPKGLGVLKPLSESDPQAWEKFKRQNATVTVRLEDRSEPGFPRIVTAYRSGSVTFNFVHKVTATELEEALEA